MWPEFGKGRFLPTIMGKNVDHSNAYDGVQTVKANKHAETLLKFSLKASTASHVCASYIPLGFKGTRVIPPRGSHAVVCKGSNSRSRGSFWRQSVRGS